MSLSYFFDVFSSSFLHTARLIPRRTRPEFISRSSYRNREAFSAVWSHRDKHNDWSRSSLCVAMNEFYRVLVSHPLLVALHHDEWQWEDECWRRFALRCALHFDVIAWHTFRSPHLSFVNFCHISTHRSILFTTPCVARRVEQPGN